MQPLRANSPTEDFKILEPVVDESTPEQKLTTEYKELASASQTKDGKIILDHLQKRVDDYTQALLHTNYSDKDPMLTAASVMAAQSVIQEFEAVLRDVEVAKGAVRDATRASRR